MIKLDLFLELRFAFLKDKLWVSIFEKEVFLEGSHKWTHRYLTEILRHFFLELHKEVF